MKRLVLYLAVAERARAAKEAGETLDIEAVAKRILLSYPGLKATVEEVSAILREEQEAAPTPVGGTSRHCRAPGIDSEGVRPGRLWRRNRCNVPIAEAVAGFRESRVRGWVFDTL